MSRHANLNNIINDELDAHYDEYYQQDYGDYGDEYYNQKPELTEE
jgi:hypothetical protein